MITEILEKDLQCEEVISGLSKKSSTVDYCCCFEKQENQPCFVTNDLLRTGFVYVY